MKNNAVHDRITKIKLTFSCMESIVPYTITPGVVRSSRKLIFSVSKILRVNDTTKSEYNIPFTVQIPMVQFPPSVKHPHYRCEYKLSAAPIDTPDHGVTLPIIYMPFIETSLLKSPLLMTTTTKELAATIVQLYTLGFVPGDDLNASIKFSSSLLEKKQMTVVMEVRQNTCILAFDDVPDQVKTICSKTLSITECHMDMNLLLPADLTPSFVGNLVSVSYTLHIRVESKGMLLWKNATKILDTPIVIGTLGYGIQSYSALKSYSAWNEASMMETEPMPLPVFMDTVEYEDALPVYESSSLPCYYEGNIIPHGVV